MFRAVPLHNWHSVVKKRKKRELKITRKSTNCRKERWKQRMRKVTAVLCFAGRASWSVTDPQSPTTSPGNTFRRAQRRWPGVPRMSQGATHTTASPWQWQGRQPSLCATSHRWDQKAHSSSRCSSHHPNPNGDVEISTQSSIMINLLMGKKKDFWSSLSTDPGRSPGDLAAGSLSDLPAGLSPAGQCHSTVCSAETKSPKCTQHADQAGPKSSLGLCVWFRQLQLNG